MVRQTLAQTGQIEQPGHFTPSLGQATSGFQISIREMRLKSAKGAARTAERIRNRLAPHSVLRVFLRSAKGAARTAKRIWNWLAPGSVFRESLIIRAHIGFVSKEMAHVGQRRTRNGQLPVENGVDRQASVAVQQEIAFAEVAVDQARFVIQFGELRHP